MGKLLYKSSTLELLEEEDGVTMYINGATEEGIQRVLKMCKLEESDVQRRVNTNS